MHKLKIRGAEERDPVSLQSRTVEDEVEITCLMCEIGLSIGFETMDGEGA